MDSKTDRLQMVKSIPNFDKDIFFEITWVKV